jgi:entericidin B
LGGFDRRETTDWSRSMIRNLLAAATLAALALTSAGCNTVEGVGEDIKSVGRAGKRAID